MHGEKVSFLPENKTFSNPGKAPECHRIPPQKALAHKDGRNLKSSLLVTELYIQG